MFSFYNYPIDNLTSIMYKAVIRCYGYDKYRQDNRLIRGKNALPQKVSQGRSHGCPDFLAQKT